MDDVPASPVRRRGRGARPWLLLVKFTGLVLALGGMAALASMWLFGPTPATADAWTMLIGLMRSVFFPCFFAGIVITVVAGTALLLRQPSAFVRTRWFRVKAAAVVVALPALHLWGRGRVLALYDAIDSGRLDEAAVRWNETGVAFAVAFVVLLAIAMFARFKPRLGERLGARAVTPSAERAAGGTPRSPSPAAASRSSRR